MSTTALITGAAIVGASFVSLRYLSKQRQLSAAAQKIVEEEHERATKAANKLQGTVFFGDLQSLREQLEGQLILPTDEKLYQECRRRPFNMNQRGFPLCIVRPVSVSDVQACIRFTTKHRKEINLCVASGGHSSKCMMDDSFVIDLIHMNKVQLSPDHQTVTVEGGAYLEQIDKTLEPHNLGVPVGTYPLTGVGGLTLGGGYGLLARMYGFTVDNFLQAEVVLFNGDVVIANDDNEFSDLIWGLRGGSGNFGIVTKFVFRVYKLPTYAVGGLSVYLTPTFSSALNVALNFDKITTELPNNMGAFLIFPGGALASPTLWAHFGEEKSVAEIPLLQKATKLGGWFTLKNDVKLCSYHKDLQLLTTAIITSGHVYHTLIQFGEQGKPPAKELWETVLSFTRQKLHPSLSECTFGVFVMGGKMATNDPDGTKTCIAASIRRARYFGIIEAHWKPEFGEDGKNEARNWARTITKIIKPFSNEALRYAAADNSVNTSDVIERDSAGYGENNFQKLADLKKKYDPSNFFRNNVNIIPAE